LSIGSLAIAPRPGVEETGIVDPEASRVDVLKRSPLFASLSPEELEAVASAGRELRVPAGQTLVSQATPGWEVVVILGGAATVEKDGIVIGLLGPGEVIGEIGVLTRMSRTATVATTEPSHLLVIDADAFRSLMERIPLLSEGAWEATAARLKP
jgi:CRP/FNR family cyclic AMP-dependent transcriptional regulator